MFGISLEEKKDYIAKIAGDVFFAKGYQASSLQDISLKGNLSKAGIYHYFKTKEDILSYLLHNNTEQGIKALKENLRISEKDRFDARKSFEELVRTYATYLLKNKKISLLVLRERHQLGGGNRKILLQQEKALFQLLKNELKKVQNLKPEINLNLISFKIISMIHWMGYWLKDKGELTQKEAVDQNLHLIFNGILENQRDKGL
jgi:AcrR family transcriptional regulator